MEQLRTGTTLVLLRQSDPGPKMVKWIPRLKQVIKLPSATLFQEGMIPT